MTQSIGMMSLLVREYGEAIDFFTRVLRFNLVEDTDRGAGKRWVIVAPQAAPGLIANKASSGAALLLAKANTPEQTAHIGNQNAGRVMLFLYTTDFTEYVQHLHACGVKFVGEPRTEDFGQVVVFYDLYGNKWDLIEAHQEREEAP
jgi:catechol 2,3-dioxygenase-like lactoylglutathione lyase family enzyme